MVTTATRNDKQPWLDAYAATEGHDVAPLIRRLRQAGIAAFDALGFPGPRDEDWKFTNLTPVLRHSYQTAAADYGLGWHEVPGIIVCTLAEAVQNHAALVEPYLGRVADHRTLPIVALNTAFLTDGVFVHVPAGVVVEMPVTLSYATNGPGAWHRRALIVVERGAQLTLVEEQTSPPGDGTLTTRVTEVVVADNASVDHYVLQDESRDAFALSTLAVQVACDGRFSTNSYGLGGKLVRHEVRVTFTGSNAEATVNGLYHGTGTQHFDNHTVIDHAVPHCNSHELYKGILDGRATGVFRGKIDVRQDAQKTDAKQTNQTLLLSDDATIYTKPQLEIFADDVKCTHGATVGQLDEKQLFYLRSRGVGADQARALLTFAFANDLVGRVRVPALRRALERRLLDVHHLPATEDE